MTNEEYKELQRRLDALLIRPQVTKFGMKFTQREWEAHKRAVLACKSVVSRFKNQQ